MGPGPATPDFSRLQRGGQPRILDTTLCFFQHLQFQNHSPDADVDEHGKACLDSNLQEVKMPCHCGNSRHHMQIEWVVFNILHLDNYVIGMQFKMYSALGRYRKNSYGGIVVQWVLKDKVLVLCLPKSWGRGAIKSPNPVPTALEYRLWPNYIYYLGKFVRVLSKYSMDVWNF